MKMFSKNKLDGIDDPIGPSYDDLKEIIQETILNEHYINLFKAEDRNKVKDVVWKILKKSYEKAGGMIGMESPEQLVDETDMWKLCKRNGKINAAFCYSTKRVGRKVCYAGCDMTPEGKEDLFKIMKADMAQTGRKVWAEISDRIEHIYIDKMHAPVIPVEIAQKLLKDKPFEKIDPDGYHYWRRIGGPNGKIKRKIMVGVYDAKDMENE